MSKEEIEKRIDEIEDMIESINAFDLWEVSTSKVDRLEDELWMLKGMLFAK